MSRPQPPVPAPTGPLAEEARRLSRYLIDREPSPEIMIRYAAAHRRLLSEPPSPRDRAWLAFSQRHPWALGPLDAGAGLAAPGSLLRRKIYLMAAVLEASPDHREKFLPENRGPLGLALRLGGLGIAAVVKALAGLALTRLIRPAASSSSGRGVPRD